MTFQETMSSLERFWAKEDCLICQPYDLEKGAGTFNPATFFGALTEKPVRVAYVEPSRRPTDGRYGENPNRLSKFYQYQVLLKPVPENIQKIYLMSLKAIGLDPDRHDIRWIEDDWESPTLGASGVGWEVWLDAMEITQFTYFQQMAGVELFPVSVEITYGLERLALFCQKKNSVYDLLWNDRVTYGEVHKNYEKQFSKYHFEGAVQVSHLRNRFESYEKEAESLLSRGLYLPAYDMAMKCSHVFNLMDARGAVSVTERAVLIGRVRNLTRQVAQAYLNDP